tara:strand:+ start:573 stop:755 length:183 start_codon:yes stop_codon:yes gene_type:complete
MLIENAKYIIHEFDTEPTIVRADVNGVLTWIPMIMENIKYAEIMRQVEAGELTIAPADEE